MNKLQYVAVSTGTLLLLSVMTVNASALRMQPTTLSLDSLPSVVSPDDQITFTGTLTNANAGEGLRDKTIVIFREGPIGPMAIAEALTGIDGGFSATWTAALDVNRDTPVTVFAQFDGDEAALPSRTSKTSFRIALIPINLEVTTDSNKNRYSIGSMAFFSVAFHDGMSNFIDPDFMRATYDGSFVSMNKEEVGRYTFTTQRLVKFEEHQFGVFAEKFGYTSTQKSLTVTVFGAQIAKPVKVSALKMGDDVRIKVKNNILSPGEIYTFMGKFIDGSAVESSSGMWQFSVNSAADSFSLKSLEKSLAPDKSTIFKVKVQGTPTKLLWQALDLHGKQLADGTSSVVAIRSR
ncbi:MAG: hypothetical protein ACRD38_01205 [Nitrososphaerales archaeon]